ncbi:hypothetical protein Pcinc_030648 [Petrolisthes cinctipes]|uniref:ShKT domain-containing protein n=1 Tax=Petrolisthes cinctipes TaxID=88211 RepID=A0AAE1EYD7_PETCI|nr:hypothetical protein Pcinc_030648 [Petrolisthes cinctipes]
MIGENCLTTDAFLFPNSDQLLPLLLADDSGSVGGGGGGEGASCVDIDVRCQMWSQLGECTTNPSYMLPNCPRSCHLCTPPHVLYTVDDFNRDEDQQQQQDDDTSDSTTDHHHLVLVPWRGQYYVMENPSQRGQPNTLRDFLDNNNNNNNRPSTSQNPNVLPARYPNVVPRYPNVLLSDTGGPRRKANGCYYTRAQNRRGGGNSDDDDDNNDNNLNPHHPPPTSPLTPPSSAQVYSYSAGGGEGVLSGGGGGRDDGYHHDVMSRVVHEPRRIKRMVNKRGGGKGMSRSQSQDDRRRGQNCNWNVNRFIGTRRWQGGGGKKSHQSAGKRRQNDWNMKEGSRKRVIIYKPQHQQQQYDGGVGGEGLNLGGLMSKKVDKIRKLMSAFGRTQQQPSLHVPPQHVHWKTVQQHPLMREC